MAKILKVGQSNYTVQVQTGGNITLDTGLETGTVFITGDLTVKGNTTTLDTTNMTIEDNLIVLNKGELGAGVSEGTSGIEIDRGTLPDARFIFDEGLAIYNPIEPTVFSTSGTDYSVTVNTTVGLIPNSIIRFEGDMSDTGILENTDYYIKALLSDTKITLSLSESGATYTGVLNNVLTIPALFKIFAQPGVWTLRDSNDALTGLSLSSISGNTNTDFVFDMQDSGKVLTVANAATYITDVTKPGDIITKGWAEDYVIAVGGIAAVDRIFKGSPSDLYNSNTALTRVITDTTNIQFQVNTGSGLVTNAYVSASGLFVNNINLFNNTIQSTSNATLKLSTTLAGNYVEIERTLELDDQSAFESNFQSGKTRLYSRSNLVTLDQTPGRTGLFFTNTISTDELVSKNRALLFSILF
jgi:hypothetical protein